jgi:chemotaxis protein MotA
MVAIGSTREDSVRPDVAAAASRGRIDFATIGGLAGGFGLLGAAMAVSGTLGGFVDLPSVLIVIGGTIAVTAICYSTGELLRAQRLIAKSVLRSAPDPRQAAILMLRLCEQARKAGLLNLQAVLPRLKGAPFLHRCMTLAVDGVPGPDIERMLKTEIETTHGRHMKSAGILRRAAEIAPAMGLIGTLIGLVQMLGNLNEPETLGPSMAVALLTTFYGAVLGNMVCAPLAAKLERNAGEEALVSRVYLTAAASIGGRDHPGRLQMMLNTLLPPAQRVQIYD